MKNVGSVMFVFPDPRQTHADGLLCIGGDVSVATLLAAYRQGIFPWPQEGYPLLWFSPEERGILDFKDFHVSQSFKKFLRKTNLQFRWNTAFSEVIKNCAEQVRPEGGTWITEEIIGGYTRLYKEGYAYSAEAWTCDIAGKEELVGGVYGVSIDGFYSGESMFFKKSNASKFALYKLIEKLQSEGIKWIDVQMVTPHLDSLGGKYISRDEFLARLIVR